MSLQILQHLFTRQCWLELSTNPTLQPHLILFPSSSARHFFQAIYLSHWPLPLLFITLITLTFTVVPFQQSQTSSPWKTHRYQNSNINCILRQDPFTIMTQQTSLNFKLGCSKLSCSTKFLMTLFLFLFLCLFLLPKWWGHHFKFSPYYGSVPCSIHGALRFFFTFCCVYFVMRLLRTLGMMFDIRAMWHIGPPS